MTDDIRKQINQIAQAQWGMITGTLEELALSPPPLWMPPTIPCGIPLTI